MGETRDNALEEVQQTVRDTVGKVQSAATSAVDLIAGGSAASGQEKEAGASGQAGRAGQSESAGQGAAGSRNTGSNQAAGSNTAARNQEQKPIGASPPPRKPGV